MELANENNAVSRTLKDVDFYPYSISLSRIQAWLDSKQLRIQFTYKLGKDSYYETKTEGNKVVIQFTDSNGNVNFDETFYLETAPEKEDLKMEIGEHDYKMVRQDTDLVTKIQSLTTYKMSVYYEISGKRKLLAEQTMDWFGITE